MPLLQDVIHKVEEGGGMRFFRAGLGVLTVVLLMVGYNFRAYRNMSTQEAMDAAQVGRNLAQGKGFTTLCVRPFSIYLLKRRNEHTGRVNSRDPGELKQMHPDLANPPVYPLFLAGLMKALPFHYQVDTTHPFWSINFREGNRMFYRYQPDFLISLTNQVLFFGLTVMIFFIARQLFDKGVAWLSAILLLATELFWRFSVSGLSTMVLMIIFTGMVWALILVEREARAPQLKPWMVFLFAGLAGLALGAGMLTRYSFGWLLLPVLGYVIFIGGQKRYLLALLTFAVCVAVVSPWLLRNYKLCGNPFGTAAYSVLETTVQFPENRLQRSLDPNLGHIYLPPFWTKLVLNTRQIITNDIPKIGGSFFSGFFLAGLLIAFRNPAIRRLRYFIISALVVLTVVQALGRTQLSEESPEINSENLLVLLAPLVLVYGVSLFFLLLDQLTLPFFQLRYVVIGAFGVIVSLPMIFVFLPPKTNPISYPPYLPPAIQNFRDWTSPEELIMSDVPWAVAWYGERQCIWLTLDAQKEFFTVHDYMKPVALLYLTPVTMDGRFLSQWIRTREQSWGSFVIDGLINREVPPNFPLRKAPDHFLPDQFVLTDWERWNRKTAKNN